MKLQTVHILSLFLMLILSMATGRTVFAQDQIQEEERVYIKIQVDGLSCPFCAYGLEKKLKEVESARDIHIDVKEGYAMLNSLKENQPGEAELKEIVKKAGFTSRLIEFSETPFEKGP